MVVDTGTAILILGAFVLPGFITLILRERLYVVRGEDTTSSAIIYGVLLVTARRLGLQGVDLVEFRLARSPSATISSPHRQSFSCCLASSRARDVR